MAVPADFRTLDISGRFIMNKTLSDTPSIDNILSAQGVSWMLRKSIGLGTVTLGISHYHTPSPSPSSSAEEHIDITETLNPSNIKGTPDRRVLVWDQRVDTEDWIFGPVGGRTRRLAPVEGVEGLGLVDDDVEWMKSGWTEDTVRDGIIHCRDESLKTGKKGWVVVQFWGIEEINAERRYTRHLLFTGGDGKVIRARFVYDYVGPL